MIFALYVVVYQRDWILLFEVEVMEYFRSGGRVIYKEGDAESVVQ